ncbi:MAG: efflux RND transporter permease subunit, partial [Phycisphaerae bacterium]|nr:efflux RND transporter permease subunit [Phycisphaerae bacterium]
MLSQFFIARPVFATVISVLITLLGAVAYFRLPVEQYPDLAPPIVRVAALYPGANAKTIAETVAATLEQEINGVERMIYMTSTSSDGRYELDISFEQGADIDLAAVLVQNRVSVAESRLPEEVRRLGITTKKQSTALIGVISIWSDDGRYDDLYLSNYITLNMKDELSRVPGVGGTAIFPAKEYGMRVWLDPEKLKARELTVADVNAAIAGQNVQVAAGAIGRPPAPAGQDFEFIVSTKGRLSDPEEFGEIIIKSDDRRVVRVRDVARVELGARDYSTIAAFNGKPAGIIPIYQLPGANLVAVAEAVEKKLEELKADFPDGLQGKYFYDSSMFIRASLHEVNKTLVEAFVLVFLVVLLFLQSLRATLIPALTIPVSLIGTFALMAAFGFSVNMLTMFGLVLAIGIVVDDAIVVVENVERKLKLGLSAYDAARETMDEVGTALIAIAIVLSAVFIPTAFVGGITGQFYRQFAVTVATATVISAFVSLTLSPALAAILFRGHEDHTHQKGSLLMAPVRAFFGGFNWLFDKIADGYARLVRGMTAVSVILLGVYAVLIGIAIWLIQHTPTGFIPQLDRGIVIVSIQLPPGSALERTNEVMKKANAIIQKTPGVAYTNVNVGRSGATFTNASNAGGIFVVLEDFPLRVPRKITSQSVAQQLRQQLGREIEEAQSLVFVPPPVRGVGSTGGFSLRLQDTSGIGSQALSEAAQELIRAANATPGLQNVFTTFQTNTPQVFVDVDRVKAQMLRVPLANIFEAMRVYMGSAYVNDFNMFGRTYRVTAQADGPFRIDPDNIARIKVRNVDGQMVPLGSLVTYRVIAGPDRVPRYNLFPTVEIQGGGAPGVSSGQALQLMRAVADRTLPDG